MVTFLTNEDKSELEGRIERVEAQHTEDVETLESDVEKAVKLPTKADGTPNKGSLGQFATADGKGGVAWKTVLNAEEVKF